MTMASTRLGFVVYTISYNTSIFINRTASYWPGKPISAVTYLTVTQL